MKTSLLLLLVAVVMIASRGVASAAPVPPAIAPPSAAPPPSAEPPSGPRLLGPPSEALPPAPPEQDRPRAEKSPLIALALSIGVPTLGLAVGIPMVDREPGLGGGGAALVAASAIVGPSLGWFYAGRPGLGLATIGARVAGGALLFGAVAVSWESHASGPAEAAGLSGVGLIIGATLIDVLGPPAVIASDSSRARMAVVPMPHPRGGGLALAGSF